MLCVALVIRPPGEFGRFWEGAIASDIRCTAQGEVEGVYELPAERYPDGTEVGRAFSAATREGLVKAAKQRLRQMGARRV